MNPWDNEPDFVRWLDPATGLRCVVLRGPVGALNGYVAVPPGRLYRKLTTRVRQPSWRTLLKGNAGAVQNKCIYDKSLLRGVRVHGGLTFSGRLHHYRMRGKFWLGFDCAHAWDLAPDFDHIFSDSVYRDMTYVKAECTALAAQIKILLDKFN